MVRTIAETLAIFVVTILILGLLYMIPQINSQKATGAEWLAMWWREKGYLLMIVGTLYFCVRRDSYAHTPLEGE